MLGESQSHGNPEKMLPSNVLISLEAEKILFHSLKIPINPLLGIFFMTIQKWNFFRFCVATFTRKFFQ